MPLQKPVKLVSRREEKELLEIGEELFRTEFPNPKRLGCPRAETLRTLAFQSQHLPLSERNRYLDHMTCCSPCFSEFSSFVDQARHRKRLVVVGLCAVMSITIGLATWLGLNQWRPRPGGSVSQKPPSSEAPDAEKKEKKEKSQESRQAEERKATAVQQPQQKIYREIVLDVRDQAVTRGESPAVPRKKYPQIPRGQLNLSIYLPFGSQPGKYQVRIYKNPAKALLDITETARIQTSITVLKVKLDTSQLSPGKYALETRPRGWTSGYTYTFLVAE